MLHPPAAPPGVLPEPTAEERALSAQLGARIDAEIAASHGALPFARFMELALYAPGLGYYSGARHKFGAAGDFVTAPELGPVFARCLARQCAEILDVTGGELLEAGAGSGALAAELLLELERLDRLPARYLILELSAALRAHQQATLRERAPHLAGRVTWLDSLPAPGFRGVVLGNELLDALPVERFRVHADDVARLAVGRERDRFVWREIEADAGMRARLAPLALPPGYESEIGFAAEGWVRSLADSLEHGVLLLIDYGFPRGEFYHPQRTQGTLMCHYRHRAHTDPLILVGLQDITAHVDFSAIAQAGAEAGLAPLGYASQSMFLLGCGLEEVMTDAQPADARARLTLAAEVKKLTLPHEMGELFKAIALGRGIDAPLRGFRFQDRRAALGVTRS
jgi:SAM-dependent MidA family methyltransferase